MDIYDEEVYNRFISDSVWPTVHGLTQNTTDILLNYNEELEQNQSMIEDFLHILDYTQYAAADATPVYDVLGHVGSPTDIIPSAARKTP